MKILCVIDSLCSGGAQRQMVELAMGFDGKGHSVSFLTYHSIPFYNHFLEKASIPVVCIEEHNYLRRLLKMRRYIRHGKFDVVLSFLEAPNFICEIAGLPFRKWKLIVGERSANPVILKSLKLRVYRWFHLLSDYVVANSEANLRLVYKANPLLKKSKCRVIYNLVDFERNQPSPLYQPRKEGLTQMIIAGRQAYPKNLIGLVNALIILDQKERDGLNIQWYGDREKQPDTMNTIEEAHQKIRAHKLEKTIEFLPVSRQIEEKIKLADVVGLFSIYEGFPNFICEGMACAKPVVCSDVSDLGKLLSHCPNMLCDPHDSYSIRNVLQTMIRLSNKELLEMGLKNEQVAHEHFSKEAVLSQYLRLFKHPQGR
jgi:glycosyltransferase involved in cell wall biosynthesis